jgi:hypothetical protein
MDVRREPVIAPSTFASVRVASPSQSPFFMWASEEAAGPEPAFHDASRVTVEREKVAEVGMGGWACHREQDRVSQEEPNAGPVVT